MKIFLILLGLFLLFTILKARYHFKYLKDKMRFYLAKVNEELSGDPNNALHYIHRGIIYQKLQNFPAAQKDFQTALRLIEDGFPITDKEKSIRDLNLNIEYTIKPLPWSKNGPKDLSRSFLTFYLIERFGNRRVE